MKLCFITGNKQKFAEALAILPNLEQMDIHLPEIQSTDAKEIIRAKLLEALNIRRTEIIVEDTSLYFDCLNGLPGPLIKWFMKSIGNDGLFNLAEKMGNVNAEAKTIVGYAKSPKQIYFFEGSIKGKIISPVGKPGFGWSPIFQPEGFSKSFAELTLEEKIKINMRGIAFKKLKNFLEEKELRTKFKTLSTYKKL